MSNFILFGRSSILLEELGQRLDIYALRSWQCNVIVAHLRSASHHLGRRVQRLQQIVVVPELALRTRRQT
jgi:hypothetical protein